jgi:hypothetical protein
MDSFIDSVSRVGYTPGSLRSLVYRAIGFGKGRDSSIRLDRLPSHPEWLRRPVPHRRQLIDELSAAFCKGKLSEALPRYTHPALFVVDEVGYLTHGTDTANMLFHLVNERHLGGRSMIFTTNKHPNHWGAVFHDEDLAAAIVDRILERGRLFYLDGPSMRTRHLALDKPTPSALPPKPDRISGIMRTDFPESTQLFPL